MIAEMSILSIKKIIYPQSRFNFAFKNCHKQQSQIVQKKQKKKPDKRNSRKLSLLKNHNPRIALTLLPNKKLKSSCFQ